MCRNDLHSNAILFIIYIINILEILYIRTHLPFSNNINPHTTGSLECSLIMSIRTCIYVHRGLYILMELNAMNSAHKSEGITKT